MENAQTPSDPEVKKAPIMALMLVGAFVAILNETLLVTALPHIMDEFEISANTAQWLTTGFLLTNGVMIPVTAFLIERFSTRALFLTSMSVFAGGTLIAGLAPSFLMLLTGRIVQAAGAGIMLPLMMNVFLAIFPIDKRGSAMGMAGLVIAFAPAIGPTLSGWIVEHHSWRVLFHVIFPIAIIVIIVAAFTLKNVTKLTYPKIDVLSIILSSFGFGSLLYGFSSAGNNGWDSSTVVITLIAGAVILGLFLWRQLRLKTPMLEFRVFKYNIFALTLVIGMIVIMALLGAETLLPIYMQNMRGFTALESGLMLLPGAIVMGIMSPITGKLFDKFGARWLAVIGLAIVTVTTFMFTDLTASTPYTFLITVYATRMLGLALVMMPVMTAGLNQLPQPLYSHGTAMANTMQQVAGSIGTALLTTVMTNSAKDRLQDMPLPEGTPAPSAEQLPPEAMIHGMNSALTVAAGLALAGVLLSFFIKRTRPELGGKGNEGVKGQRTPVTES